MPTANSGASKTTKKLIWGILITIVCIPILFAVVFFAAWFWYPDTTLHDADAGFVKAKKTINPERLREWALEEIAKHPVKDGEGFMMPNSEIPNSFQTLYSILPEDSEVYKEAGQTIVGVTWGGPFLHWSFDIGSTNYVPLKHSEETTVEWVPGIYYSRDSELPFPQ